ncbi:Alpha-1,3-mannosyl-glycoprotein 2-beta-N-acetylglucosaminyltransferase [Acorus calamus]|uniref:Alpha-1,3-mannosyl-glycoprotein 2-beta-N-acetylglucosaminyltransferase n=1 Tax=Acorus calamus TaxID=4465 RepID=A0AAV9F788_ACOCL|nr:Alpha-1,3-mannosyl-glycoprotein 2-beta-N-acetylglucosaminyltransferase [Acorus calamus]
MARSFCDVRILLIFVAVAFILIQIRLYRAQSYYEERLSNAIESERQCTSQMRSLIDRISMHRAKIVALEGNLEEECAHVKARIRDLERRGVQRLLNEVPVVAVVVMACNRADYLERTIESVLKYQSSVASKFPLFISQDGTHQSVKDKALSYSQIIYMQHLDFEEVHPERPGELIAYYKIACHYKWALDELFIKHNFSRVIILEDDMEIAPDFFEYFEAAANLLDNDKTIMAVSSWNDNGQGSSFGQFFNQYLKPIKMNDIHDKFLKHFAKMVSDAKPVYGFDAVLKAYNIDGDVRIQYNDQAEFERIARQFGIFEEWKASILFWDGIPRTAYKGVVVFRYQTPRRIFLVGPDSLRELGIER